MSKHVTSTGSVEIHPLAPEDAAITAAMRARQPRRFPAAGGTQHKQ